MHGKGKTTRLYLDLNPEVYVALHTAEERMRVQVHADTKCLHVLPDEQHLS